MANPILHIKDSYYFEIPKAFWRANFTGIRQQPGDHPFPDFWVRLDSDYQQWAAAQMIDRLGELPDSVPWDPAEHDGQGLAPMPDADHLLDAYQHWKHSGAHHAHAGKPFTRFLREDPDQVWFQQRSSDPTWASQYESAMGQLDLSVNRYREEASPWSEEKIAKYNAQLDGKVLIPQPFGELRNLYEKEAGFAISRFMVLEIVVAAVIAFFFIRFAARVRSGEPPRGKLANLLEAFLLFLRDEVARPAIGKKEADKFVPLLWSIFFFVLGMNLFGMLPWAGAPTGAFAVTFGMACVTFTVVLVSGSRKFGILGFWKNQVPSMGLPWYLGIIIVPMIFAIEVLGLFIKHGVLAVRLLANMVAGHLVLLGIMGMAFSLQGAMSDAWPITAVIALLAATLFSCLELFVAFLQAYIFTFLSALFIGTAVHHH
ncbi:MAG: F0F1 ATP synthase subunit A [Planctomycetales bacterium]|nr:F0F1 ATP synthase subunit A [Planctomycetales bacterium]